MVSKKRKELIGSLSIIGLLIFLGALLGWVGNEIYHNFRAYNGLSFISNNSHQQALEFAQSYDLLGDWVCINSKGMTFDRCVETASHECSHEVFAEVIEKHPEKIEKVMETIGK